MPLNNSEEKLRKENKTSIHQESGSGPCPAPLLVGMPSIYHTISYHITLNKIAQINKIQCNTIPFVIPNNNIHLVMSHWLILIQN